VPINVVVSYGSQMIPYLEVGFPLRCFQRLSIPDIATRQCFWRNSRQTRGQFTKVLSYYLQIFSRIDACSGLWPTCLTLCCGQCIWTISSTFVANASVSWLAFSLYGVSYDFPRYCLRFAAMQNKISPI